MSYENLRPSGFDALRAMDVSGCLPVRAFTLVPAGDPYPTWIDRAVSTARYELNRAGLEGLLDEGRLFLAGGALLRLVSEGRLGDGDLDVCQLDGVSLAKVAGALRRAGYEIVQPVKDHVQTWEHGASEMPRVQVVTYMHFPTVEDAIGRHDLHVCQWALTNGGLWCTEQAYMDARDRRLTVNHATFPEDLLRRLRKYAARGYTVTPQALDAVIATWPKP